MGAHCGWHFDACSGADRLLRRPAVAHPQSRTHRLPASRNPAHPTTRFYNTVVGHLVGLLAGFGAVALLNAWDAPAVLTSKELVLVRVFAAVIAMVLTSASLPYSALRTRPRLPLLCSSRSALLRRSMTRST